MFEIQNLRNELDIFETYDLTDLIELPVDKF